MAVSTKGWRRITVGKQTYRWRAIGTDWGIDVVVVTTAAFTRGRSAQQLRFTLEYDHHALPRNGGATALFQRAAVTPHVIRLAIEHSLELSPPFTGAYDAPNIILPSAIVTSVQAVARIN